MQPAQRLTLLFHEFMHVAEERMGLPDGDKIDHDKQLIEYTLLNPYALTGSMAGGGMTLKQYLQPIIDKVKAECATCNDK
jgi:hypothetical protein